MRFQVSQAMDTIEQRLTTDVAGAQAVVDLGAVITDVELDRGRPVSLVRVGMVVDALSRYLVDGGAMLYGVLERRLLSDQALTSKERMVLGRWAGDGLIEVTPSVGDRVVEIADLTGLPLITIQPYPDLVKRFGWLAEGGGRVLQLVHRVGVAALRPMDDPAGTRVAPAAPPGAAVGRARVPVPEPEPAEGGAAGTAEPVDQTMPLPVQVFTARGAARVARTRISRHRFRRAEPGGPHAELLRREWRCESFECPSFGEHRRIGQPVPRMRGDVPVCPRHDEPVTDAGPRPPAYAVSIVVDDLPRRRLVVRGGEPVQVGRGDPAADSPIDPPEVFPLGQWLHEAAAAWVSPVHVRLVATLDGLEVTDVSENGAVVWQRTGPDDPGTARPLRGEAYTLGEWDSVELYTGIELVRGDRRLTAVLGRDEVASVLVDAPTAAHHQVGAPAAVPTSPG